MKMNKKILALVAAGALTAAVGLFGCGSGGSQPAAEGSGDTSETSAAPVMTDAGYKLVKPGTLTVYTNAEFEPFEYLDGDEIPRHTCRIDAVAYLIDYITHLEIGS